MNIFDELEYRGLIKDYSNAANIKEMLNTPQTIYCGLTQVLQVCIWEIL